MKPRYDTLLLQTAASHWAAMSRFREDRERCKRYTYGRQWDDFITYEGRSMRESDYIRSQGNIPLKNNLIRRIVRNVVGVFRNQYVQPKAKDLDLPDTPQTDRLLSLLDANARANMSEELYARTMEEFLISGLAVHRKSTGTRNGRQGVWTDYVQPDYFIIDTDMRDFRGWDASLVGEIHDIGFSELIARMGDSPERVRRLREIYSPLASPGSVPEISDSFGDPTSAKTFLTPTHSGLCRVIEIWRKEPQGFYRCHDTRNGTLFLIREDEYPLRVEEENRRRSAEASSRLDYRPIRARWSMEERWRYYFLAPTGEVLSEGDSPYAHGGHPYIFKAYPFIDGEIHSFVSDLIDQQRYVNRLVTLYDWVMRASAKGVLLFPEGSLPDGVDIDEISDEWSRFNGVILFKPRPGTPLPQQISGNAANIGITELLEVQLRMMEDVSGVNGALQGKLESGAVSGTLYEQQTRHALTGLLDILQSYGCFIRESIRTELLLLPESENAT